MLCTVTIKHSEQRPVYKHFGIDKFYDATYYDMSHKCLNLGLKDKIFFKDSANYQAKMKSRFYSHLITLTNHYPFTLDEKDATIEKSKQVMQQLMVIFKQHVI